MVVDRYTTEWHLTPAGWVHGTYRFFDAVQGQEVSPPTDRVETWVCEGFQQSAWSAEETRFYRVWFDPKVAQADRDALRSGFPSPNC